MYKKYIPKKYDFSKPRLKALEISFVRVPSTIDSVTFVTERPPKGSGKSPVHVFHSDIHLLLNAKRLDRMTLQNFSEHLDSIQMSGDNGLSSLRSAVPDGALLQFCKSRYLQSASELKAWSSYLTANSSKLIESMKYDPSTEEPIVEPPKNE